MNILSSQSFLQKAKLLPDSARQQVLNDLVIFQNVSSSEELFTHYNVRELQEGVFELTLNKAIRLFFTLEKKDGQENLVFIDLLSLFPWGNSPQKSNNFGMGSKNPRLNASINPRLNASINPRLNAKINPRLNTKINPRLNANINPRLNAKINPRLNANINPRLNANINPRLNASINPRLNASINPRLNSSFAGPYRYTENLEQTNFQVKASELVSIVFTKNLDFENIIVKANDQVSVIFNSNNEFIGYIVENSQGGWVEFNLENEFIAFWV